MTMVGASSVERIYFEWMCRIPHRQRCIERTADQTASGGFQREETGSPVEPASDFHPK